MKVTILLADFVQVSEGKLNIIGGGWSVMGTPPPQSGIAVKIDLPWDQTNIQHTLVLELKTEDGQVVRVPGPSGELQPVRIEAKFEAGRPPGLRPGTAIDVPVGVNVGPMPLTPGARYRWELSIDGDSHEDWGVSFETRALAAGGPVGT